MNTLLWLVVQILYLYAPLLLSAALSALVMRLDWFAALRIPLDGGLTFRGERLFGASKTWRGVWVAIVGCILGAAIQRYAIGDHASAVALLDYTRLDVVAFGTAMGGGAMLGELPNSFVKRRLRIPSGGTATGWLAGVFYVWDQIDLLMLSWPLLACWVHVDAALVLTSLAVTLLLHPLSSLLGYALGARRSAR